MGETPASGLPKTVSELFDTIKVAFGRVDKRDRVGSHVALKILSGYASHLNEYRNLRELEIHQRLASLPAEENQYCTRLVTHFVHKGIEQDANHLCLALELEQANLGAVWHEHKIKHYPIPIVKRILRHMLHGMAAAHKSGIAHTGSMRLLCKPLPVLMYI